MSRNERLDKEVHGLLNTIRDLERENKALNDNLTKNENLLVFRVKGIAIIFRTTVDLLLSSLMGTECGLDPCVIALTTVFQRFVVTGFRWRS